MFQAALLNNSTIFLKKLIVSISRSLITFNKAFSFNFFLCTYHVYFLFLNEDIVDIEKLNGICLPIFVVDEFSGLFLSESVFSIKH